jgi:small subunit ribosomal protein S20
MVKYLLLRLEEVKLLANIKSAEKRIRTTEKKTVLNKNKKSEIKTYTKKFNAAIESGNTDEARELLKIIDKKLKKAACENIVHKNAAARKVSRLTKDLNRKVNAAV